LQKRKTTDQPKRFNFIVAIKKGNKKKWKTKEISSAEKGEK